jgi:cell division protein FtsB
MRWLIVFLSLTLIGLQFELWLADDRLPALRQLERDVAAQSERNSELAERNADLTAEIEDLLHGKAAAEERARAELGLSLPNETFFQFAL